MSVRGGARRSVDKVGGTASAVRENPYIHRLIEDAELRENIREAVESARVAYGRMSNGKGPAHALLDDRKTRKELRKAVDALQDAGVQLRGKKRKRRWGRVLIVALVGAGLALALSESARKTVLDKLFGSEEEFEYTSTTAPAPAPATATTTS